MNRIISLAIIAFCSIASTACISRRIIAFDDHPKLPVTSMEVLKHTNYLFIQTDEHQFYLCQDTGSALSCNLQCGGPKNDLVCPKSTSNGRNTTSNVR
jgi:hypothetical protein